MLGSGGSRIKMVMSNASKTVQHSREIGLLIAYSCLLALTQH